MPIRGRPLPLRPRPMRKSPASPMLTGKLAAATTDLTRKTGIAPNATFSSAGPPPNGHSVERADPEGTHAGRRVDFGRRAGGHQHGWHPSAVSRGARADSLYLERASGGRGA